MTDAGSVGALADGGPVATTVASARAGAIDVPVPPFWGAREVRIDWRALDQLLPYVDRNVLFRHHWGYRGLPKPEWDALAAAELEPRLHATWRDAKLRRWLEPAGAYGFFPVLAAGDALHVFDAAAYAAGARGADLPVAATFGFPRQVDDGTPRTRDRRCISDYFRGAPDGDGSCDVIVLQVVTAGRKSGEHAQALMARGEYDLGLKVHGVAASVAEAMADWLNARVRRELGLGPDRCKRYSWGYGACPDLSDQAALVRLLPLPGLGVTLTEGFQWDPEQSTAAFVVHHPRATYFNVLERATP